MTDRILINTLVPVVYNPQELDEAEMEKVMLSIREHSKLFDGAGYRLADSVTINVNGNRIVGGKHRIDALKRLGQDWIDSGDIVFVDVVPDGPKERAMNEVLNSNKYTGQFDEEKRKNLEEEIKKGDGELYHALKLDVAFDVLKPGENSLDMSLSEEVDSIFDDLRVTLDSNSEDNAIYYPVSIAVSRIQRDIILSAVEKCKNMEDVNDNGNALFVLIKKWADKRVNEKNTDKQS